MKKYLNWVLILSFNVIIFFLGMYAYKNEDIRTHITSIFSISEIKNISYSNYSLGENSIPKNINLIISDSSKSILNQCQKNAIKADILRDKNKIEVPAFLIYSSDTFNISMRLKGDLADHWNGDKWSYRIKLKGKNRLFGMKTFSLQSPSTRRELNEWYFHKLLKYEGFIALRYSFINLTENGTLKGIYAIEEGFDKQLIEFNHRREGPILKFDESIHIDKTIINKNKQYSQENIFLISDINVFKTKRTLKAPPLYNQFKKGKELLNKLRSREITLAQAMDIEKAAKLFAIADLTGGHHALRWKNVRFYFNPVVGKLEFIGFDSNSGYMISDIYYNKWINNEIGMYDVLIWKNIFLEDSDFLKLYFKHLERYSSPIFLKEFHQQIKEDMKLNLSYIYKENSSYVFSLDHYIQNAKVISQKILEYEKRTNTEDSAEYFVSTSALHRLHIGSNSISLSIKNNSRDTITVFGIFDNNENLISINSPFKIAGRSYNKTMNKFIYQFKLNSYLDSSQIDIKRKNEKWVHKRIKLGYILNHSDTFYSKIEHYYELNQVIETNMNSNNECFKIYHSDKTIKILPGKWVFNENVITPKGYTIICEEKTSLELNNGAIFVMNGRVLFNGTKENPILITSKDASGSFIVIQANDTSQLNYVDFINLSESYNSNWQISGSVNFYESDVILNNIKFMRNNAEDALNIIRSNFTLFNCTFKDIKSDAFDGDFCIGEIENCNFQFIGDDAIDFSGSTININNVIINHVEDKGISAGEMSFIYGNDITIKNSEIGVVSKDMSYLKINNIQIDSVSVAYAVLQKKEVFGPAKIELSLYQSENYIKEFLIENNSIAIINNVLKKFNHHDVYSILYNQAYVTQ
jgi:hypothetical protein